MRSNRRQFVRTLGTRSAGIALSTTLAAESQNHAADGGDGQVLFVGDNIALTQTEYGKVRGYQLRGIYYFLGMAYGADTSGANRFMPPQKPKPWADVYPALWWGNSAPQNMEKRYENKFASFRDHWNYGDVSEDCLRINVLTPGINDGKKRPVLFWIHGGGFTSGNALEQDGYGGENFARFGDVVFCSINHRLGPLGYCNLAGVGGERFAASGNVGMLDIVAALEWVRDNIANFGGDPGNVTIMGQSGGGAKVCILTAMPSAKGLFHKAVVLSGASLKSGNKTYSESLGAAVLKEAGLGPDDLAKLQAMPWKDFYAIATRAQQAMAKKRRARCRNGAWIQPGSGWQDSASGSVLSGGSTNGCQCSDDYQFRPERAIVQLGRCRAGIDHAGAGGGKGQGTSRLRRGLWRQSAGSGGVLREGVSGPQAGGDLVACQQQSGKRGGVGGREIKTAGRGVRRLVYLAASFVR